jgi:lipopolysaccharide export system protein LptA
MIMRGGGQAVVIAIAAALAAFAVPAAAQSRNSSVPNAVQGFSQNRDEPVHIEAGTLEVRNKDKVAVFSGDVHVVQGDTDMRCRLLVVYYEGDSGKVQANPSTSALPPAGGKTNVALPQPGFGGQQRIRRLEAKGGVVVKRNNQVATGKTGIFDMISNTVTLVGDVVVSQGPNVTRGDRLVVNLTTGVSRVESGKNGTGRVRALIQPSSAKQPGANGNPAPPARRPAPSRPLSLN